MTDAFNVCHVCERPKWHCDPTCEGHPDYVKPREVVRIRDKETSFPVYVDRAD